VTQPVFDARQLEAFLNRVEQFKIPIVAGIWPLISLRNAEFLANEVPGVSVPDEVLHRMREAQAHGKDAALAEGVAIARDMFSKVKSMVQGVQVSAPFGRVEVALQVFQ
jgi:homocysteine S-methyltransferase